MLRIAAFAVILCFVAWGTGFFLFGVDMTIHFILTVIIVLSLVAALTINTKF